MRWRLVVVVALAVFWALVVLGGAVEPGYSHVRDHVSRLASFGATSPALGIAAIASLATAHASAALLLRRSGAVAAAVALGVAALAGYLVAAFRIHCPGGAAGCRGEADAGAWTGVVHGYGVAGYQVALLAGIALLAWRCARRGRWGAALLHAAFAAASLLAVLRIAPPAAGADQRLWLAVSTAWLLVLAARSGSPADGGRLAEWARAALVRPRRGAAGPRPVGRRDR